METISAELDTSYTNLNPKDALKSKLSWNSVRPPLSTYTSTSNNFVLTLPRSGVILPSESFISFQIQANQGNTVANNVYTNQVQLSSSYAPFRRIDVRINNKIVDSITDPAMIQSLIHNYTPEDYMRSVALDTGLYAPDSVQKYYEGGSLTNEDVLGSNGLLLPRGNQLLLADITTGGNIDAQKVVDRINELNVAHSKDNLSGINNILGLSLAPANNTGVNVGRGNYYRMKLSGLFADKKLFILLPSQPVEFVFYLDSINSCYYHLAGGANAPTDYTINNFQYHMKQVDLPTNVLEQMINKLVAGDTDIAKRSYYRYETYRTLQQSVDANVNTILISHPNINLPNVKAIFVVFRKNTEINNLNVIDKKSCFSFPTSDADKTTANVYYQFVIDEKVVPDDQVQLSYKNTVRAFDYTLQAFDMLDNLVGGTRWASASFMDRGNFIVGMKFKAHDGLAPTKYVGKLEFKMNMDKPTDAVYSCQTIIVYDTELAYGASLLDVSPPLIPSA